MIVSVAIAGVYTGGGKDARAGPLPCGLAWGRGEEGPLMICCCIGVFKKKQGMSAAAFVSAERGGGKEGAGEVLCRLFFLSRRWEAPGKEEGKPASDRWELSRQPVRREKGEGLILTTTVCRIEELEEGGECPEQARVIISSALGRRKKGEVRGRPPFPLEPRSRAGMGSFFGAAAGSSPFRMEGKRGRGESSRVTIYSTTRCGVIAKKGRPPQDIQRA